ncbi:unnamed protein product [Rotaria sordida]|uniref:LamG-like jellyroll fold domain-containing protein n=1 Tax=Rotaria sordida TaxID=392033 RepID=A0A814M8W6_9BILA|nr:unnamed protein product [Rotaria sordida]CAF1113470.1 unnamed protein product [Rotaria sordida]CAF1404784.1 unnamed protein product [Rotaria sordida]CAF1409138.1 unnamed protein product [Rotaria sordida]CAF3846981.1 unnamed protein product [Rotaria sordida]
MIGFNALGRLTIQTLDTNAIYATSLTSPTLPLNQWTHVSMTYSTANGIQLFVNGSFAIRNNSSRNYTASNQMNTITVGTCLQPNTCAFGQTQIVPSQFRGKIDELKIFSRELSISEVGQLAQA